MSVVAYQTWSAERNYRTFYLERNGKSREAWRKIASRRTASGATLVSSRCWNTNYGSATLYESHGELARLLIGRLALLELARSVLARTLEPFPAPVRTVDALHLASIEFLRQKG